MIKNWSFGNITDILQKKLRSLIVSQNHYLNKILDVHPLVSVLLSASVKRFFVSRMQDFLNAIHVFIQRLYLALIV